ncbi:hypothetical protein CRG98_035691, partial [Punica granatum]
EEWVVCRVFQKSSSVKIIKPQQSPSSQSLDSPCDTNSVPPEFNDIDFPNLSSNFVGHNNSISNNISPHHALSSSMDNGNNLLSSLNDNNLTWAAAREMAAAAAPSPQLPWASSILSSTNLAMNSLILKALQLKSASAVNSSDYSHHHQHHALVQPQGAMPTTQFGMGTELEASFHAASSSSKQQQGVDQVQQQQQQEQPFNWTPFNDGI